MTIPSVTYKIIDKKDKSIEIKSPKDLPDANNIKLFEPMADIKIFTPASYLGNIIELCTKKEESKLTYNIELIQ